MARPKLLFFSSRPPFPSRSGLERRCLEMLKGFRDVGCETTLVSAVHPKEANPWSAEVVAQLEKSYVHQVQVYQFQRWSDRAFMRALNTFHHWSRWRREVDSAMFTPPGLRAWFRERVRLIEPDLILIVFARWNGLLHGLPRRGERRLMETIDLSSLNSAMWAAVEKMLPTPAAPAVDPEVLSEDFYERLHLSAQAREFAIYDAYDVTIAISPGEAEQISSHTKNTRVVYLPMTMTPVYAANTYDGAAIFPTGPNPFNEQAGLYFVLRVLPSLRRLSPDFRLWVTGTGAASLPVAEGIEPVGFVPDLAELYRQARFLACPVIGGTGQLVKVIEAMAHGVPPVVLEAARHRTIIRHEEDGLIARDAEEFAVQCSRLWNDRSLCRRLGEAARARIAAEFSPDRLVRGLQEIVHPRPAA